MQNDLILDFPYPSLLSRFSEISAIPRPSGKEEQIAAFLCDFAKKHGLEHRIDEANNVLIRRPASPGMEDRPSYLLQGHTDMVCEQVSGKGHDFENEGITVLRNGELLTADGTTLGADNGVAVAIMMDLLTQTDFPSPTLECLFTSGEETGLNGAMSFDGADIQSNYLINLDNENLHEMALGCAGSDNITLTMPADETLGADLCALHKTVHIEIDGLAGGHSGVEIHKGGGNAILLCGMLLSRLYQEMPFGLVSFAGGGRLNVIPPSAKAVIAVTDPQHAIDFLKGLLPSVYDGLPKDDQKVKIRFSKKGAPASAVQYRQTGQILRLLTLIPNGVLERVPDQEDAIRTSSNAGLAILEQGEFSVSHMARSYDDNALIALDHRFENLAALAGGKCVIGEHSPGWKFEAGNPLAIAYTASHDRFCQEPLQGHVIHAGLECGVLQTKIPHPLTAISVGPSMWDIHSPKETLSLPDFATFYTILRDLLQRN